MDENERKYERDRKAAWRKANPEKVKALNIKRRSGKTKGGSDPILRTQRVISSKLFSTNTTGYRGVDYDWKKALYRASITVRGKRIFLGRYKTAERASLAYEIARDKYFK